MINRKKIGKKMLAAILCGALICTSAVPAMAAEVEGLPAVEASEQGTNAVEENVTQTAEPETNAGEEAGTPTAEPETSAAEEAGAPTVEPETSAAEEASASTAEPEANAAEETVTQTEEPEANVAEETAAQTAEPETNVAEENMAQSAGPEENVTEEILARENEAVTEPSQVIEIDRTYDTSMGSHYYDFNLYNQQPYMVKVKNTTEKAVNINFEIYVDGTAGVQWGSRDTDSENVDGGTINKKITLNKGDSYDIILTLNQNDGTWGYVSYSLDKKISKELLAKDNGELYFKDDSDWFKRTLTDYISTSDNLEYKYVNHSGKTLICNVYPKNATIDEGGYIKINGTSYQETAIPFDIPVNGTLEILAKGASFGMNLSFRREDIIKEEYDITEVDGNSVIKFNYKDSDYYSLYPKNGGKIILENGTSEIVSYYLYAYPNSNDLNSFIKINAESLLVNHEFGDCYSEKDFVLEPGQQVTVEYDARTQYLEVGSAFHKVVVVKTPATCTQKGKVEYRCTEEGCENLILGIKELSMLPHTPVTDPAVAATCTTSGKTEGSHCSVCGTVLTKQEEVPATGHSFGEWVVEKQPTVFEDGMKAQTCTVCGARVEELVAKLQPAGKLSMATVPLKVKQTTTALKVTDMAAGDAIDSFVSSNTKIATVDRRSGKITAKKKGTATIIVTLKSGLKLTAKVKVQTGNVKTTKITANVTTVSLDMKKTFQLKTVVAPLTSKEKVTFKSSNSKIVTVSKTGKLTAKKPGKATITVQSGKKKCYVKVTVNPVKTTGITVNKTQVKLKVKKSFTLKTKLTPGNSTEAVTYKTSNKKVATVSSKGKITAKKAGTATITVKSGNQSVKVQVTVTKK